MITIYLHTGTGKTGTSAIQAFLNYNRENLIRDFSCLYPNFSGYSIQKGNNCHNHCRSILKTDENIILANIGKAVAFSKKNNISKIIISCEGLFGRPDLCRRMSEKFPDGEDVSFRIIVFFRRQDHFFESSWKQWGSKDTRFLTIDEYIDNHTIRWLENLRKFESAFEKKTIIVHPYEKEQMPDGLISEFLKIAGIPFKGYNWIEPPESNININLGFNRDIIEILSLNKSFYKSIHDNTLLDFFYETLPEKYQKKPYERYNFLSPSQRITILEKYEPMNQIIAREYLGREDNTLFYEPWPEPNDPWQDYEGLSVEKIIPVYTQMLFNLEQQHRKQKKIVSNPGIIQRILRVIRSLKGHPK